jgi:putative ABC transport system permease protein
VTAPIEIGTLELAMASGFILVAGGLSIALRLGIVRSLLIASVRTYAQLLALGLVLRWIFGVNRVWVVVASLLVMGGFAVQTLLQRVQKRPRGLLGTAAVGIFVSGATVTFAVTALILRVDPWHDARYVLPIAGMVLGNSMTGISIALERLFDDLRRRREEVWTLLALGATAHEASRVSIRTALRAGLIPTINSMSAVGVVSIPGMMTGQVLAGADPAQAARYQIVVMLMISAATALGAMLSVRLGYRRAFDDADRLVLDEGKGAGGA